ncbi:carbamoyltransferase C-terminal domain-containing protein [Scytonema sp. NUACC26]|uniref:carbamoyltransferase C-terminal domain-containing protein n=1 Tax=Scytonema sp. NUACC26 TaxID=3140176 RepID=UPI0034DC96CA
MIFLGFYLGYHDSNVAISVNGKVRYAKSERITGIKHHRSDISFIKEICTLWGIEKPDAIAFSDGNRNNLGSCELGELAKTVKPLPELWADVPTFYIEHHYAHILSGWPIVPTEKVDVGIAIDGRGDNQVRTSIISRPGSSKPQILYYNKSRSIGSLLKQIGALMNLKGGVMDLPGKVMGAQAYGKIDYEYVKSIDIEILEKRIYDLIFEIPWNNNLPVLVPGFFNFDSLDFRDWLATIHHLIENYIVHLFERYASREQSIIYSGGCAQNVVVNEKLAKNFPNLFIPPHCYDGGISLGCLEFLRLHYQEKPFSTQGFPYWQNDFEQERPTHQTIKQVVELLQQGKIVGWFQGRGEIGPRALGHRSILMDARNKDAKDIINRKIKHRESWRPYALSILDSMASDWLELDKPSPYMLRSVLVKQAKREIIPAVVHFDGTSRAQTVADDGSDELTVFAELLSEFYRQTGIPILLNTSLNSGGSPIFSSSDQSLKFFNLVPMDAICIGNKLFIK